MPYPQERPYTPKPNIKRGPEGVTIMGQPTYSQEFLQKVNLFEHLCFSLDLVPPVICPAEESDLCDVTSIKEVRFKPFDGDWRYQVRHVFAHWLCDLHSGGYANHSQEEAERADKVADVIAGLIYGYGRANTGGVLV